ncbi:MAG: hypothetical protein ACUVX8_11435 [Candidatus Zipacnadales bacterium]
MVILAGFVSFAAALGNAQTLDELPGWTNWSPAPTVEFVPDTAIKRDGARALRIDAVAPQAHGCWVYTVPTFMVDHEYRLTAFIRTQDVTEPGAMVRAEFWAGDIGGPKSFVSTKTVTGTTDWQRVEISFRIPHDTTMLKLTPYLITAAGHAWFDELVLENRTVPTIQLRLPAGEPFLIDRPASVPLEIRLTNATEAVHELTLEIGQGRFGELTSTIETRDVTLDPEEQEIVRLPIVVETSGLWRILVRLKAENTIVAQEVASLGVGLGFSCPAFNRFGGAAGSARGKKTGFFHTELVDDRWWLIDPEGDLFFSVGVNHILYEGDWSSALGYSRYGRAVREKYAGNPEWALSVKQNLGAWNFNTVGAFSSPLNIAHPYTLDLNLGRRGTPLTIQLPAQGAAPWLTFPDVFDPQFEARVEQACSELATYSDDPYLLGYFTDNELAWWNLLESTRALPEDAPARRALMRFERTAHQEPLNIVWDRHIAERYYSVTSAAIRRHDPNHLVLGHRYAGHVPEHLLDIIAKYCDLVSLNFYNDNQSDGLSPKFVTELLELGQKAARPVMITEWSFRGNDTGHPNTRGAGAVVGTQTERAKAYASFVSACAANPYIVGCHWFEYFDQPPEGRGNVETDGENSNYGLVTEADEPYLALTRVAALVNGHIYELASHAKRQDGFAAKLMTPTSLVEALSGMHQWISAPWLNGLLETEVPNVLSELAQGPADKPWVTLIPPTAGQVLTAVVRPLVPGTQGILKVRGAGFAAEAPFEERHGVAVAPIEDVRNIPGGLSEVTYELIGGNLRATGTLLLADVNGGECPGSWEAQDSFATVADNGHAAPPCFLVKRNTPGTSAWLSSPFPVQPRQTLRLAGWFRAESIKKGPGAVYHMGNVALYFFRANGEYLSHNDLLLQEGTFDWTLVQRSFRVPESATQARIYIRLIECTGALYADDLVVVIE